MAPRKRTLIEVLFVLLLFGLIMCGHLVTKTRASASPSTLFDLGRILNPISRQDNIDPEEKCRNTLAALGASQLAYARTNDWRYGDMMNLHDSLSYDLRSAFRGTPYGYSIGWYVNKDKSDFLYTATVADGVDLQEFIIDSRQVVMEIDPVTFDEPDESWEYVIEQQELSMQYNGNYWWFESGSHANHIESYLNYSWRAYCIRGDLAYIPPIEFTMDEVPELIYISEMSGYYTVRPSEVQIDTTQAYSNAESAVGTLRAIASSNRAYADYHDDGTYGDFYDLQEDMYIAEGYTPDTMVEGYAIEWYLNEDKSLFAVVAIPTEYTEFNPVYIIDQSESMRKLIPVATYTPDVNYREMQLAEDEIMDETGEYAWEVEVELTGYESDIDVYMLPEHDEFLLKIPVIHGVDDLVYVSSQGMFYSTEVVR